MAKKSTQTVQEQVKQETKSAVTATEFQNAEVNQEESNPQGDAEKLDENAPDDTVADIAPSEAAEIVEESAKEVVYETTDGQKFYKHNDALNHSLMLADKEIKEVGL